jgi:hypothetical protein
MVSKRESVVGGAAQEARAVPEIKAVHGIYTDSFYMLQVLTSHLTYLKQVVMA